MTADLAELLNSSGGRADDRDVQVLSSGDILVDPRGRIRIVRSRTASDDGWNCTDGAPILDDEIADTDRWTAYTPEQLAHALHVAEQVQALSTEPMMAGGIRTWDACSGRPCVLPKLAGVVREQRVHIH